MAHARHVLQHLFLVLRVGGGARNGATEDLKAACPRHIVALHHLSVVLKDGSIPDHMHVTLSRRGLPVPADGHLAVREGY